jgi:hypothetical protein
MGSGCTSWTVFLRNFSMSPTQCRSPWWQPWHPRCALRGLITASNRVGNNCCMVTPPNDSIQNCVNQHKDNLHVDPKTRQNLVDKHTDIKLLFLLPFSICSLFPSAFLHTFAFSPFLCLSFCFLCFWVINSPTPRYSVYINQVVTKLLLFWKPSPSPY